MIIICNRWTGTEIARGLTWAEAIAAMPRTTWGSADLTDANLTDAVLTDADLTRAVLTDADLTRANLTGAVLTDAVLTGADLDRARRDLRKVFRAVPAEIPGLLAALRAGRIDGSVYEGECACLVGTLAKVRGAHYESIPGVVPDPDRPIERLFLAIGKGYTPENHPIAKIVAGWIVEWQAEQTAAPTG